MATTSYADFIRHWGQLNDQVKVNPELAPFEPLRAELEVERQGLIEKKNRQSSLKAETQETTREIDGHVARGREAATRLRDAIKAMYSRRGEKLTAFGIPVARPTAAKAAAKARGKNKKSSENKPSEPGPNPGPAAASDTHGTT
jgi:peptidoglycan hydrolase CwlO-like protein